jgi:hypothetical protein
MLNKFQEQYQLFCEVHQQSAPIEQLANAYLKDIVICEDKQIDVTFQSL